MTALAGWATPARGATSSSIAGRAVESLLSRMPARGNRPDLWSDEHAALGVARHAWEDAIAPGPGLARSGDRVLVADATLFDLPGLRAALGSSVASATTAASLMLAAYEAWGDAFIGRLNGDFAFVLWDGRTHELLVGRDFVGRRSLFIRTLPSGEAGAASHATALAHAVGPTPQLNEDFIAAAVAGLLSGSRETAFAGIVPVPAGSVLRWRADAGWRTVHRWAAPMFRTRGRADFQEGSEELRRLLTDAVADRCTTPRVAVYLSGGADSPAVFGVAGAARERGRINCALDPVSVSFPVGDSAREDEHIEAVAGHWSARPTWIDSESMALFDRQSERVAVRDDPYAHTFEQMNRYLGRVAHSLGAEVALDGHGGDLLFQVSDVAIAEVLFAGDVRTWRRMLREGHYRTWREILRWGVAPALPDVMWRTVDAFRDRALQRPFQQDLPAWLTKGATTRLLDRGWNRAELTRRAFEGPAAFESRWYLEAPYMARAISWTHDVAQQSGLELRSPLMDRRVVEFAATRPVAERASVSETKRLLREAVRGLVPESVLAPRPYKSGVPRGYLGRQLQHGYEIAATPTFGAIGSRRGACLLADAGIVDLARLEEGRARYIDTREHLTGVQLFLTLEAELWLRNHGGFVR